ncbi:MAG TPA: dihydrofolate reductase family protein [Solirubrobacteraceae bacterium]|jgi:dihydrofolate reductase|nr:dihydrofolate reductase family protein [Solirubrobacteraceae bacterium]
MAMRLTVTTFLTLDGVVQAPGGPDEDRSGEFAHGGWLVPYADDDMGATIIRWFTEADAFLLGRKTYEIFAGHWPRVPDDNPIAAALNKLPKYVVSTTLQSPKWEHSTVIGSRAFEEIADLKAQSGRELQVHGSGQLAQALIAHDLVDEYRLLVFPVFLGSGRRLFEDPGLAGALRLVDSATTAAGVLALTYEPAGEPKHGSFALDAEPEEHRILR